jgi:TerC family integral membrane protein
MAMDVSPLAWLATVGAVLALLAVDLAVASRRPHAVGFREAAAWSVFYVAIALAFGVGVGLASGWEFGTQFFTGYAVEKSLSVDNLFVFALILSTFAVPAQHQHRALTFGIVAALLLRSIFIAVGAALLAAFSFVLLLFGLLLVGTGIQLFRHRDEDPNIDDNVVVAAARRLLPFSDGYDGGRLVTYVNGRRLLTPMSLVLVAIASTDVLFALDSIPAIFGITRETYIVFSANAFALLGLRALYFLVAGLLDRLVYLSAGLAAILVFIGVKLGLEFLHEHWNAVPAVSALQSLVVITAVLAAVTAASMLKQRRDPDTRAHAGSLRHHERRAEAG